MVLWQLDTQTWGFEPTKMNLHIKKNGFKQPSTGGWGGSHETLGLGKASYMRGSSIRNILPETTPAFCLTQVGGNSSFFITQPVAIGTSLSRSVRLNLGHHIYVIDFPKLEASGPQCLLTW